MSVAVEKQVGEEQVSDVSSKTSKTLLKVGSRKSDLALYQTRFVAKKICEKYPDIKCEIETMDTVGDLILDKALPKIGEKSLFTTDLENALRAKSVDLLVHSLKDLPTDLPEGLTIGMIVKRDPAHDVVIFHPKHKKAKLADLPPKSIIGTSSLRRIAQLKRKYPHLLMENVRGNLNTRLRKLDEDNTYDGLVLAAAGVHRMNWAHRIGQDLTKDECLYAVGQGAIAVEIRADDKVLIPLISSMSDTNTLICIAVERAFLRKLEGGCSVPIGVHCTLSDSQLSITGAIFSLDGSECIEDTVSCSLSVDSGSCNEFTVTESGLVIGNNNKEALRLAESKGEALAKLLQDKGADAMLLDARQQINAAQDDLKKPLKEVVSEAK